MNKWLHYNNVGSCFLRIGWIEPVQQGLDRACPVPKPRGLRTADTASWNLFVAMTGSDYNIIASFVPNIARQTRFKLDIYLCTDNFLPTRNLTLKPWLILLICTTTILVTRVIYRVETGNALHGTSPMQVRTDVIGHSTSHTFTGPCGWLDSHKRGSLTTFFGE